MNYRLLYQWEEQLSQHLPSLSSWQVQNLAMFSYGVIEAENCQQGAVARQVNTGEQVESTARRWRRWLANEQFGLTAFCQEWSGWLVSALGQRSIPLLVDETKLGDRLAVMLVGIAWEGRCLPLAWRVYRANSATEYPAEEQVAMIGSLLQSIKAGMPEGIAVLVLADRGIGTSPQLCRVVAELGWQYLFRVTCQTKIVMAQGDYTLAQQVQPGEIWQAEGKIFETRGQIPAHARAYGQWAMTNRGL